MLAASLDDGGETDLVEIGWVLIHASMPLTIDASAAMPTDASQHIDKVIHFHRMVACQSRMNGSAVMDD